MKRIGFTSGSFDPVTNGHLDVIRRAARMVDELVIGIGVHPGKTPLFSTDEKIDMLKAETAPIAKSRSAPPSSSAACAMPPTSTTRCRWPA
jgi:pantetheine-phosphate adenylyltransferase